MRRNNKRKNGFIFILCIVAVFMAVGYAVYSSDLVINATGKILSDWDVRFTAITVSSDSTLKSKGAGNGAIAMGSTEIGTELTSADSKGVLELDLWAALTYFDDKVTYEIEITNYSEMFDADLVGVEIEYDEDMEEEDRFITWTVTNVVVDTTSIAKDTTSGTTPNKVVAYVTATWDATKKADGLVPSDAKKDVNATDGHEETATITFTFEAGQ